MGDAVTEEGLIDSSKLNNDNSTIEDDNLVESGPLLCTARWRLTFLLFFTFLVLYMHRVNMSLAVVCMVKPRWGSTNDNGTAPGPTLSLNTTDLPYNVSRIEEQMESGYRDTAGDHCTHTETTETQYFNPEMDWDYTDVSILLSSYFYGSFFTQVPAGRLADYFGGKHIITVTHAVTGVSSLLVPICARTSFYLVLALRIVTGLAGGAVIPVGIAMLNVWAPPNERATMIGLAGSGFFIGTIVSYLSSGLLCVYGFDNGWPTIFYTHGLLSCVLLCFWCVEAFSHPEQHPRISQTELTVIKTARQSVHQKPASSVPWGRIFTSTPMWSCFVVHFASNWSIFTILINVPLFLEEVLKFGVRQNGLYSALPYVFCTISTILSPKLAQIFISRRYLGHLFTRRLFSGASLLICALALVATGYVTCETREVAVVLLCVACFFMGSNFGGFLANHSEFAGQYAGTVYGITNAGGVISALLASMTAGLLTPQGLQEEWQRVFYISAGINLIGALAFTTCSSVKIQDWALTDDQSKLRNTELVVLGGDGASEPLNTPKT